MLVTGPELLLAERAVARVVADVRREHPEAEASDIDAREYGPGALSVRVSPSLFEEHRVVVLRNLQDGTDDAIADALRYLPSPVDDVVLVLQHTGGGKGRKLLDQAKVGAGVVVDCAPVKTDADRLTFVGQEFSAAGRRVVNRAAQALVDAFGSDLRELASACAQLMADTDGDVDEAQVRRYYGGRAEATGFEVADAVVSRRAEDALLQLRRAIDSGVDPIPMVAVIAMKLRAMAKVATATGPGPDVARELGMASWMVDRARRDLRAWSPGELAAAIIGLAEADCALKGGVVRGGVARGRSEDDVFTIEQLVLRMTRH